MVSIAPAEKPTMPMRSGSTFHSAARLRTGAKAARASAICGPRLAIDAIGSTRCAGTGPDSISRIDFPKPSRSAGVWLRRYFSTNAATPRSASARATSQPSFCIDSERKPPPGATITAVPVALAGSGRNGVSVATVTLRANTLPYWRCQASGFFASGSAPVPSSIAAGCAGMAMEVIASSCALAGAAIAHDRNVASATRPKLGMKRNFKGIGVLHWAADARMGEIDAECRGRPAAH